jgi:hypothetical protein
MRFVWTAGVGQALLPRLARRIARAALFSLICNAIIRGADTIYRRLFQIDVFTGRGV